MKAALHRLAEFGTVAVFALVGYFGVLAALAGRPVLGAAVVVVAGLGVWSVVDEMRGHTK